MVFEREKNNVTMKSNNKIAGLANIDERTLFLNIYSKIDKDNEDFNVDVLIPNIEIKGTGRNTTDLVKYTQKYVNYSSKVYGQVWVER